MFFCCFAAFLLLAPLYKAGNRPLPLLLLELAALGFLFAIVAVHRAPIALPRTLTGGDRRAVDLPAGPARPAAGVDLAGPARAWRVRRGARPIRGRRWRARMARDLGDSRRDRVRLARAAAAARVPAGRAAAVARPGRAAAAGAGDARRRRGRAGLAAGRAERRRDALFRQRGTGPVRGDRHVRQSQSSRGDAGDDAARDRRPVRLRHASRAALAPATGAVRPRRKSSPSERCCSRRR